MSWTIKDKAALGEEIVFIYLNLVFFSDQNLVNSLEMSAKKKYRTSDKGSPRNAPFIRNLKLVDSHSQLACNKTDLKIRIQVLNIITDV